MIGQDDASSELVCMVVTIVSWFKRMYHECMSFHFRMTLCLFKLKCVLVCPD